MNEKLKINTAAGIVGIVASTIWLLLIIPGLRITAEMISNPFMNTEELVIQLALIGLGILVSWLPTLVLFIIACVNSKKAGLSITGHILGFVALGTYLFLPYGIDVIAIGLLVTGSIMILNLKKQPEPESYENSDDSFELKK